jgi:hypothetical protein
MGIWGYGEIQLKKPKPQHPNTQHHLFYFYENTYR